MATSYDNIGFIYLSNKKYRQALEYHQKALKSLLQVLSEDHPYVNTSYDNISYVYWAAKANDEILPGFDDYVSERVFIGTTLSVDNSAALQGLNGEFVVFEFGDWTIDSETSLWDKDKELRGKPKTIVVMQDGKIAQHHFEDSIGMRIGYKKVGKEEKQRIISEYHKWKEG